MKCQQCDQEARPNRILCENCKNRASNRQRERHKKRREQGLCLVCGSPKTTTWCCPACVLKRIAKDNLGDVKRASEIGQLLERQKQRCAYTGLPLVLGVNASIDHIIPQSLGGSHDTNNLQWIDTGVNRLRRTTKHEDFKVFLRTLAESIMKMPA